MAGAPIGNKNGAKGRQFLQALEMALDSKGGDKINPIGRMKPLVQMSERLIEKAVEGDGFALKEIADRLDGKPRQALDLGSQPDNPIKIDSTIDATEAAQSYLELLKQ